MTEKTNTFNGAKKILGFKQGAAAFNMVEMFRARGVNLSPEMGFGPESKEI